MADGQLGLTQGMVCEGTNRLLVNTATMKLIVSEWLHNYLDGGPYQITAVGLHDENEFEIEFKPLLKGGQ